MTFFGLPMHPLIVHATVVFVPLAALLVLATTFNARLRERLGSIPMITAVIAAILTPLSTATGEDLEHAVGEPGFDHAELGEMLAWFTIPLALLVVAAWWLRRQDAGRAGIARILSWVAALVAVGALVMVGLIGHSGAQSAWCGQNKDFVKCQAAEGGGD
ncbi:MAG TPA: hypothetical protein PKK40_05125 [Marmoricola sp.]|nr:hypothetical protein [Marmoricola sp.]